MPGAGTGGVGAGGVGAGEGVATGGVGVADGPHASASRVPAVVASKSTNTRPHCNDDGRQRRMDSRVCPSGAGVESADVSGC